jgi:O-antigen/teichoic acid export membrane protein
MKLSWLSWGGRGVLTLVDQGLIGTSNFLIGILLARQLSPTQYGAYALAFEIFMVVSMAYSCVVLEPMLVFGPSTYRDNLRRYLGVLLSMHWAGALASAAVLGGSAWLVHELGRSPGLPKALLGAMLAVPCVLLFWLGRRACYVNLDPKPAVVGGLLYGLVLLGGAFLFYELRSLSPFVAFLLMTFGALTASSFFLWRLKPSVSLRPKFPSIREVTASHWTYGRWAFAASIASWVSGNVYYVLLSSMRGLAATGGFKALQNFASPIGQVFSALTLLALPYAARAYQQTGATGVERLSWRLTPAYAGGTVIYWVVFLLLKRPIVHFLYAGKYLNLEYLIAVIALGSIFRIATVIPVVSLKAIRSPFLAFVTFVFSDFVACLVGIPAILAFGLEGAIYTYGLSGATGLLVAFILLRRATRRAAREQGAPASSNAGAVPNCPIEKSSIVIA